MRSSSRPPWAKGFLLTCLSCWLAATSSLPASPGETVDTVSDLAIYRYRMKGKVRLLFFWVGKDDVGGGHIAIAKEQTSGSLVREEIEVLFGSNPERVPGRVNRWGYGKETARWGPPALHSSPLLTSTVFEGFIKHSKEESLDEVRANESANQGENVFWYDGIRSTVQPGGAVSEIRTFPAEGDFDYRDARPVHCSYQERLSTGGPPDKHKKLENPSRQKPFGFLTGVRHLIGEVLSRNRRGEAWRGYRPWIPYVYNANRYRLRIGKVEVENSFDLPLPGDSSKAFEQVAKVQFSIYKEATGEDHEFVLWFPLEGRYRGIPLRIVDKPRWWLRVELNLEPSELVAEQPPNPTLSRIDCGAGPAAARSSLR